MSECVVRMEMPECCEDCAAQYDCMACGITGSRWYGNAEFNPSKGRLSDCPIICSLPEGHGRLVDADALIDVLGIMSDKGGNPVVWMQMRYIAEDMHTIVPAERSET